MQAWTLLRLYSGLVLFVYVATHLLNTALGLASLSVMEKGLAYAQLLWNPGGIGIIVPLATLVHLGVVFRQLFLLPALKLPRGEWTRLLFGLTIPFILIAHYLGSHLSPVLLGFRPEYASSIYSMLNPVVLPSMIALIVVAWAHGCMGLHYWLRFRRWYPAFARLAIGPAIALPIFALAGFVSASREVLTRIQDPATRQEYLRHKDALTEEEMVRETVALGNYAAAGYSVALLLVFASRALFLERKRKRRTIKVRYADGAEVMAPPGASILNASRLGGIAHAAMCGGRGRCSTCRVQILSGGENLSQATQDELRVLTRIGAAHGVRLACCAIPGGEVQVRPLIRVHNKPAHRVMDNDPFAQGREMDLAILFADLRGFTRLSERKLPYDVVFLLNQYFELMGAAIEAEQGHVDKFIGDGIMALFGLQGSLTDACKAAVRAALKMDERLRRLNDQLEHDLSEPLGMGIGIHCGHVIAGRMGYGAASGLTAIGDPVNTASRLESMTRELDCKLVLSEDVCRHAGLGIDEGQRRAVVIRGREAPLPVYIVAEPATLRASLLL